MEPGTRRGGGSAGFAVIARAGMRQGLSQQQRRTGLAQSGSCSL